MFGSVQSVDDVGPSTTSFAFRGDADNCLENTLLRVPLRIKIAGIAPNNVGELLSARDVYTLEYTACLDSYVPYTRAVKDICNVVLDRLEQFSGDLSIVRHETNRNISIKTVPFGTVVTFWEVVVLLNLHKILT